MTQMVGKIVKQEILF